MKRNIMRKWVAALRSGRFKQGRNSLISYFGEEKQHCCLGVLCAISPWKNTYDRIGGNDGNCMLPEQVQEWASMRSYNGQLQNRPRRLDALSKLNDSGEFTFEQIAEIIEQHVENL